MKLKKILLVLPCAISIALCAETTSLASDNVEWNVYKTLQLDATPIDVAVTPDGRRIFVLTAHGEIVVYSSRMNVEAKIDVGKQVDRLKLLAGGEALVLSSAEDKTVQIVTLDFIQKITTDGAPFKGPEDATVVVAVFDDFQ
jgi:hypothetical protein